MELPNFSSGRDSLFQALALMRDDEDYRRNYGSIPETLTNRHETTVSILCDMLVRLKRETDARKQCIGLLEDISDRWRLMIEDKEKSTEIISNLEKEKEELVQKLKTLEEEKVDRQEGLQQKSSSSSSSNQDGFKKSLGAQWHVSSVVDSFRKTLETEPTGENENEISGSNYNPTRKRTRSHLETSRNQPPEVDYTKYDAIPSQFSQMDFANPGLTINPYERLDSSYYNPTQFYQRLSTNFKRSGKRGARGSRGGRKKADATKPVCESSSSTTKGGKPRARKKNTKLTVDLTVESDEPNDSDPLSTSAAQRQHDESPGTSYFDYTSTFLDETEHSA